MAKAVMTPEWRARIRADYAGGMTQAAIARHEGISHGTVERALSDRPRRSRARPATELDRRIAADHAAGMSRQNLSLTHGVSAGAVTGALRRCGVCRERPRHRQGADPKLKDLTKAPPFGRLTVVEPAGRMYRTAKNPGGVPAWRCRCECGGEKVATRANLTGGSVRSCGGCGQQVRAARDARLTVALLEAMNGWDLPN
jgi:hypothetical protein